MLKVCTRCKGEFPATSEYFAIDKRNSNGLGGSCRECERARGRKFIQDHPDKKRDWNKKYEAENPDKMRQLKYRWRDDNPDKAKEAKRRYNEANHDKLLEKDREYKNKNKEQIKERSRIRNKRPAQIEKFRRFKAKREARKLSLPDTLTQAEWEQARIHWGGKCVYCGMQPDALSLDHYIPLTHPSCPGTVAENVVPACLSCNSSKNNAEAFYWMSWKLGIERAREVETQINAYFESLKTTK